MISKEKRQLITCVTMCIVLFVCSFSGIIFEPGEAYGYTEKTGVVSVDDSLRVRSGPGTSYSQIGSLTSGQVVRIVGEASASDGTLWYQINFEDGTGYVSSSYITNIRDVVDYTPDADFEAYLNTQGFPESYKQGLRTLHAKYPKWVFVADHINLDWNVALNAQSGVIGRSLITKNAISSWKSLDVKSYNWDKGEWYTFDGGAWCAASKELVAYYMDPRNFFDESYIWMFESLSYESSYQTADKLENILTGTFMQAGTNLVINDETKLEANYADIIMLAANKSGVSPFALASSILVEMGNKGGSDSISGTVSGYENLFNYYNWGAYAKDGNTPIVNGLIYASKTDAATLRPWNTRYKSIIGGAIKFGASYINIGQDTLYYKKFDYVSDPDMYTHQYMTHIKAHATEAKKTSGAYSDDLKSETAIIFRIPVFKNMPESACPLPTGDGSPNNCLSTLAVNGYNLTPTFSKFTTEYSLVVDNTVTSAEINAAAIVSSAKVTGTGVHQLVEGANTITVTVTAENGSVRVYTIEIVRQTSGSGGDETTQNPSTGGITQNPSTDGTTQTPTEPPTEPPLSVQTTLPRNDTALTIHGIAAGSTVEQVRTTFTVTSGTIEITDAAGKNKTDGKIVTGDKIIIKNTSGNVAYSYSVVIYGDVNGDGSGNIKDLLIIQKHLLGVSKLEGVYLNAADANRDNKDLSIKDLLVLQKQILGLSTIEQN